MELCVRAIPGSAKYVGVAAPHHGQAYGSLVILTPEGPSTTTGWAPCGGSRPRLDSPRARGGRQAYATPWPLAEKYHLCVYDAAMNGASVRRPADNYGIYLVDAFGNKELIYRDPDIGCMNPIPAAARASARRGSAGGRHASGHDPRPGRGDHGRGQRLRHAQPVAGGHEDHVAADSPALALRGAQRRASPARDGQADRRGGRLDGAVPVGVGHGAGRGRRQRVFQGARLP